MPQLDRNLVSARSWRIVLIAAVLTSIPVSPFAHGPLHEKIQRLSDRIASHPGEASLYVQRGQLYHLDADFDAADADFERARTLDPSLLAIDIARAELYRDWGRDMEALSLLERFLESDGTYVDALLLRAEIYADLERYDEAVADMDRAITLTRRPIPEHYLDRAEIVRRLANAAVSEAGRDEGIVRAIAGLDAGMERLGPAVSLQLRAIELEQERGAYERALERVDRLATHYTRPERIHVRRGDILGDAGRDIEAQAAYTEALDALARLPASQRNTRSVRELESYVRSKLQVLPATEDSP
jgi:tetratricopeptide (TPR) repeat protein